MCEVIILPVSAPEGARGRLSRGFGDFAFHPWLSRLRIHPLPLLYNEKRRRLMSPAFIRMVGEGYAFYYSYYLPRLRSALRATKALSTLSLKTVCYAVFFCAIR